MAAVAAVPAVPLVVPLLVGARSTARRLFACAALAALAPAGSATAQQIDTLALRGHTFVLAHDELEGRGTGTRGERTAAAYITGQLKRLGVPGAGPDGGYLQPVPLREANIQAAGTRLLVTGAGVNDSFGFPRDFVLDRSGLEALRELRGQAIFAGTAGLAGEALAQHERLDGRVIVLLGGLGPDALTLLPGLAARGAEGIVLLLADTDAFERVAAARASGFLYVHGPVDEPFWQPPLPVLLAGPRAAAALLAGAPLELDALSGREPFEALELGREVALELHVTRRNVPAANVAAVLPGNDPGLRDEVVVYTAHYDHLGIGEPDEAGDSIYNGFSDNASGVAILLAIAEAFAHEPPARSVMFLFPTGEEQGLLGSAYYAAAPLVPLERTVAVINIDGGAPPAPPANWWIGGGDLSTLGELARAVGQRNGWDIRSTQARPSSDHWPFLHRRVPAIFLVPGEALEGVGAREREMLHQRWGAYHQPADRWHPDFPFAGVERYARVALEIGRAAANAPERPRWRGEEPM